MNNLYFIQKELPRIIRRYIILLLGATLITAISTYYFTTADPTIYEAKARLLIGPKMDSLNTDFDALRIGGGLVQTYAELADTLPMLQNASDQLNLDLNTTEMDKLVEVRSNIDTRIISIIVQYQDPDSAVDIANTLSNSLLSLSPSTQDSAQSTLIQLQGDIDLVQQSIIDTQTYIETLKSELESIHSKTQDINLEDIALISQYQNIKSLISQERSQLAEALRNQVSTFDILNDNAFPTSSDAKNMKLQIISHIDLSENLIQDSTLRAKNLEAELEKLGSEIDNTNHFLSLSLIDRQNGIEELISRERARLADQTRTISSIIDIFYSVGNNPNQITIIEPAVTAIEISDLLALKVVSSAFSGLIAALVIVIFIETLNVSNAAHAEKAISAKKTKSK